LTPIDPVVHASLVGLAFAALSAFTVIAILIRKDCP
jgi:hypothetical protein